MPFTNEEKADMVLALGACHGNRRRAADLMQQWHPGRRPSSVTILRAFETLRRMGSFTSTRHRAPVFDEDFETHILSLFALEPQASVRSVSEDTGVSRSSVWRILRKHRLHPYHVQLHQNLLPRDFQNRTDFANWILIKMQDDPDFLNKVIWSDEASFSRNSQVNLHNAHYWSDSNPYWVLQTQHQYQWSFSVWCGLFDGSLIGPVFFDQTLTADRYTNDILRGPVDDFLSDLPLARATNVWFQHDGAPAHSSAKARTWLDAAFPQKWIGRLGPVNWPARSPDMTPLDYFLWGHIKDKVYSTPTSTPQDLKDKITEVCLNMPEAVIRNATADLVTRCHSCIVAQGDLFEHFL
uniref:Putative transposable element n=1 Tax=Amblyomma sculptum TaxID=1581419 RepID=A0A1E1XN60_AMBSC